MNEESLLTYQQLKEYRTTHYPLRNFTFFLLTKNRVRAAVRQLNLLSGFNAHVVVLDGGTSYSQELEKYCSTHQCHEYFHGSLADRFNVVALTKFTQFGMLITDDDFFLGQGIAAAMHTMQAEPTLGTCVGAGAAMMLSGYGTYGLAFQVGSYVDQRRNFRVEAETSVERLQLQLANLHAQTWYVPQRMAILTKSCQIVSDVLRQGDFLHQLGENHPFPMDDMFCAIVAYCAKVSYVPHLMWLRWGAERFEEQPTWMSQTPIQTQIDSLTDEKFVEQAREILQENGIDENSADLIARLPSSTRALANNSNSKQEQGFRRQIRRMKRILRMNRHLDEIYFRYLTSGLRIRHQVKFLGINDVDWYEVGLLMDFLHDYRSTT